LTVPGRPPDDTDPAVADTSILDASEAGERARGGQAVAGAADAADAVGEPPSAAAAGRGKGPRQVRAGDTLGRYELGDELGEGGMATVFRARDRELRRDVAVKVLFPHLARRADVVRRFHREARAAAGLEHPNILRIYDVGGAEADDPPYIVMELIRGRTLLQEIEQRGAMLAEIAACIGALLGDALAAAHAAGVIHRDIKPANVLIAPGGRLLLADFGVARLETEDSLVTRTGALLGTPAYMSPEQATGDTATTKSDLYSLGATLYQLATGALPYSGSPAKVMSMIALGQLVAPVRRRPACGPDLSRLIERLMAVEPSARAASATAIAAELRGLAAAGGLGDATEELAAYFEDPDGFLRSRTPTVVTALVTAARAAVADTRLPRAMALADRASALAPADPSVTALVQTVTEGGQASRRRRRLAIGGIAAVLAGGVTAAGWRLAPAAGHLLDAPGPSDAPGAVDVATILAGDVDAPAVPAMTPGDARVELAIDARGSAITPMPATPMPATDAGERHPRDAGLAMPATGRPALPDAAAPAIDAASPQDPPVIDAAIDPTVLTGEDSRSAGNAAGRPPPRDSAPLIEPAGAVAHVIVRNDVWCNVWIDRSNRGNQRNEPLEVSAGHHVVRCVNPAGEWTQEIDVAPGVTRTLTGTLLRELEVTLAVDATIDGKRYTRGTVVKLKPGNVEVVAGGRKQFITFRGNCTLKDVPELGCYL
jgi:eukaryotic-like serine/threonine-protein kinase